MKEFQMKPDKLRKLWLFLFDVIYIILFSFVFCCCLVFVATWILTSFFVSLQQHGPNNVLGILIKKEGQLSWSLFDWNDSICGRQEIDCFVFPDWLKFNRTAMGKAGKHWQKTIMFFFLWPLSVFKPRFRKHHSSWISYSGKIWKRNNS